MDFGWGHLALYEVFDPARFSREHIDNALTTRMKVSDAIRMDGLNDYHYFPLQFRDNAPGTLHAGGVILEQIAVVADRHEAFIAWYNDGYFSVACARAGVRKGSRKGAFMAVLPQGQLIDAFPAHTFVATYHIDDERPLAAWRSSRALAECGLAEDVRITCWEPVTLRITEDEVIYTSAAGLAAEEGARARMGNRVLGDRGDELKPA